MHFDFHQTVAAAGLAPAALDIEGKPAGGIAPHLGICRRGKQIPDIVKEPCIGGRVGAGCSADGALVNVDDLVQIFHPLHTAAGTGAGVGVVQFGQKGLIQHLVYQAGLAGAGNAGNASQCSQRDLHIHIFQVVLAGAPDSQHISGARTPGCRDRDLLHPGQVLPGDGSGAGFDLLKRTGRHDLAPPAACAGAHVHQEVRRPHGILVMLHHDQGVAQIPQVAQGTQQLVIVPLVQADGGLVQNIQHPRQGGADLGCQPNPLALAAGQGSGGPGQGQVAQAHIRQKLQPGADLLDDLFRHHCHIALQLQPVHKVQLVPDAHAAEIHDANAPYRHRPGNVRKPVAAALGTGSAGHTFLQLLPGGIGLGLLVAAGDVVENALKGLLDHAHAVAPVVGHPQLLAPGAVENHIHGLRGQLLHRGGKGKVIFLGQCLKIHTENGIRADTLPAGNLNGPIHQGLVPVGDHQICIRHQPEAQAGTAGAGTGGVVEGEHSGFQLRQAYAAVLTGVVQGEAQLLSIRWQFDGHKSAAVGAGRFNGVRQTAAQSFLQNQPVHHQINIVLFVLLRTDLLCQVIQDPIHPDTGKALLPGILEHLLMLALFPPDDGRQDDKPRPLPQGLDPIHDLVDGLPVDLLAALGAVGSAHSGPQKPQIVVDLRHRAHRGAGVLGGGFLVNGDGRGKALNGIHIRFVHLPQELAGVGAEALHIPPLSLGIDGIKGQAGFSGAAQPREHHQLVPGNGKIYIFQVVFSGTLNSDFVVHKLLLTKSSLMCIIPHLPAIHKCFYKHKFGILLSVSGKMPVFCEVFSSKIISNGILLFPKGML